MKKGWEIKQFTDCIQKVKSSKKIPKKEFLLEGVFPIVSQEKDLITGYWDNLEDVYKVDKPVVVFGDHTKVIKYIDFDFVKGADGIVILLPIKDLNSKFFAYQLQNIRLEDLGYARHYRLLKESELVIPPLPEQKQIVKILDQAFEAIDQAKANIEKNIVNANELFQSKLNDIFSQKGEGWIDSSLGQIAEFKNGLNFLKSSHGENITIVGVSNFKNNFYVPVDELERVNIEGVLSDNYLLLNNDILTVRSNGNPKLIGRCILAENITERTSHSGFTIRIRPNQTKIQSKYLCHYLQSSKAKDELINSGVGISIKSLNQGTLSKLNINYPISMELQGLISKQISELSYKSNEIIENYNQKLASLEELKKSILEKAFSGELTN